MSEPQNPTEAEPAESMPPPAREPVFNLPPIVLAVIGICAAVFLLQQYVLNDAQQITLLYDGAFIPVLYTGQYGFDWFLFTRPFTYAFMHGGFAHIAINMVWLAAFGSPLANRLGGLRFALFFAVTGLASVALFWAMHPYGEAPLVGASGAISGMMGAAARFGFRTDRSAGKAAFAGPVLPISLVVRSRGVVVFLAVWMIINLATGLLGFAPGVDGQIAWEAHIGGFVAGFFGLRWFDRRWPPPEWETADRRT
ncbi:MULTISPECIES: rhomboid family intramembrane serine protease [Mesorhizobium]|uniref:Rhomboid family intramembrane serine protease n=3 Tax=Mesorhizobium TaxID=68287 RepID=A0A1A5J9G4_RHILI|nr:MULTISPECIES: rhomboid family intramembrane serine protease [Mesorhizobium]ETA72852.1 putative membrane protein [Mesorhizobium japonicum R7A]MBE1710090.1 rhomboid family intramembrane serine protease [Mesorhizobium japonicum]MBE1716734.1 rhomboid family intramembrane serine protease [Mesorhizobium japonicum]MUT25356.1 rhomboid family intramembrane serine protease [Mesorhizobium japonicum]MUT28940.1 rhomboid family intramembrane serine protease [Mesorhizobium japonicum]